MRWGAFFFVEGAEDSQFLHMIVLPQLTERYAYLEVVEYAQEDQEAMAELFRNRRRSGADCYILADKNTHPCTTIAKQYVLRHHFWGLHKNFSTYAPSVIVVCPEIEAWYLAGLLSANPFSVAPPHSTDALTKEQFNALLGDQLPQDGLNSTRYWATSCLKMGCAYRFCGNCWSIMIGSWQRHGTNRWRILQHGWGCRVTYRKDSLLRSE